MWNVECRMWNVEYKFDITEGAAIIAGGRDRRGR